jgi:hypothetical protein
MAMTSVHCNVIGANVPRVTDLEGTVTQIVCALYDPGAGLCRVKQSALAGGPLSQLLQRMAEGTMASHGTRCELR